MDEIEELIQEDNLDIQLDSLLDVKLSCRDVEHIACDWNLLEDIEIPSDKYITTSPGSSNGFISNYSDSSFDVITGTDIVTGIDVNSRLCQRSSKVTEDCNDDSQYDSGVGESLSGGEDTETIPSHRGGLLSPRGEDTETIPSHREGLLSPGDEDIETIPTDKELLLSSHTSPAKSELHKQDLTTSNTISTPPVEAADTNEVINKKGKRHNSSKRYNLRTSSVINRVETERRQVTPRKPKPKSRPAPLSKYRRKTANARERTRMEEINQGFEVLQDVIPQLPKGKLTKITTLRLAINYIRALREMLGYQEDISNVSPMEVIAKDQ